jgi:glycosyltransferase involved in cell wall biosynthesis
MNMARISYVTVVKNDRTGLFKTLHALDFLRKHHGVELIVIDGASKDLSADDVAEIRKLCDRYLSEADSGIYPAMNKGWRAASGEYIGFINAGDLPIDKGLAELFEHLEHGHDIVYGAIVVVDRNGNETNALAWHHHNLPKGTIPHPGTLVRRAVYEAMNGFDESFQIAGDREFFIRSKDAGFKFQFVPAFVVRFMDGGRSFGFNAGKENFRIDMKYSQDNKMISVLRYWFHVAKYYARVGVFSARN